MLCCPFRCPFKASSLFPGGTLKLSRRTAASRSCNLWSAFCWMLPGSFLENWRCQIRSVSPHLKLTIKPPLFYIHGYIRQAESRADRSATDAQRGHEPIHERGGDGLVPEFALAAPPPSKRGCSRLGFLNGSASSSPTWSLKRRAAFPPLMQAQQDLSDGAICSTAGSGADTAQPERQGILATNLEGGRFTACTPGIPVPLPI
jgi:hypothetical protein